jgi:RNA polymerase sigma-70 factor (ECF subfamily)
MLQDVFVKALQAKADFRGDASPMTWLYRITTNLCLNQLRDTATRKRLLAEQGPPSEVSSGDPAAARIDFARLLLGVPAELREIAVYHYVDQLGRDEIAALLGVSPRTVGHRLEEFRAAIQQLSAHPVEVMP